MGLCSETETKTQKKKRDWGVLTDVGRTQAGGSVSMCLSRPAPPAKLGSSRPLLPGLRGRVAGRMGVAICPGVGPRGCCQERPESQAAPRQVLLSGRPADILPSTHGPPGPRPALPQSALLPGTFLNIYTCMMQRWAPMAWSGSQTTVQAFRASFYYFVGRKLTQRAS